MKSYELSKYENWMCVEDPLSQIQSSNGIGWTGQAAT